MYQLPTGPRANGEVLDSAFKLARTGFVRMLPYAILTSLLSAAPSVYLLKTYADVLADPAAVISFFFSWRSWLMGLAMIAFGMFVYGASIVRVESIAQGADVGIGRRWLDPAAGPRARRRDVLLRIGGPRRVFVVRRARDLPRRRALPVRAGDCA